MGISRIIRYGMMSLVLGLLMYCFNVIGEESGGEAEKSSSHPKLVYVEGGTFLMGDVLADGDRAMLAETPIHEVELGSFLLSPYEVTVGEFRKFVEGTGYKTRAQTDGQGKATKEMIEKGWTKYPNFKAHWFKQTDRHPAVWIA